MLDFMGVLNKLRLMIDTLSLLDDLVEHSYR